MGCSPRVGIGERRGAGCSAAWTGGGACLGVRGQADVGTLRVPGSLGSLRGVPAEVLRGSGDTERTRRRGIAAAESRTGGEEGSAPTPGARAARLRVLGWRRGGVEDAGSRLGLKGDVRRSRGGAPRGSPARNAAVIRDRSPIRFRAGF